MGSFTSLKAVIAKKISSLGLGEFIKESLVKTKTEEFLNKYIERREVKFENFKDKAIYLQCSNNIVANELRYMVGPLKDHLRTSCNGTYIREVYIKTNNTFKRNG